MHTYTHIYTCTYLHTCMYVYGFPGGASGKKKKPCPPTQVRCKRYGFNPWVGKIPFRRAWQSTPVFLSEESRG